MSDKNNVVNVEEAETEERNRTPWWVWLLLLLLIGLIIVGIILFRQVRQNQISMQDSDINSETKLGDGEEVIVPTVRIPGKGSQDDHSGGLQYARINVHDDEDPNEFGWFDRTLINTRNPEDIGLDNEFSLPEGWKVERDFSLKANEFIPYFTVKPLPTTNIEAINTWVEENDLQSIDYEVTSVVVDEETEQECSVRGLHEDRVRVNIYVGENFVFQLCPPTQDN